MVINALNRDTGVLSDVVPQSIADSVVSYKLNRHPRVYENFLVGFEYLDSDHRGRKHLFVDWPYIPSSSNANI